MSLDVLINITLCAQSFLAGKWMTECSDALSTLKMVICSQRYFSSIRQHQVVNII